MISVNILLASVLALTVCVAQPESIVIESGDPIAVEHDGHVVYVKDRLLLRLEGVEVQIVDSESYAISFDTGDVLPVGSYTIKVVGHVGESTIVANNSTIRVR